MSPFKHDVSDIIREKPDKTVREISISSLAADSWDWLRNNVVNPLHNTAWAQPVNTIRSAANLVSKPLFNTEAFAKQDMWAVRTADTVGVSWCVQNITSGLGAMVPYVAAGKLFGSSARVGGRMLQVEGSLAKVLASERVAMMGGAAIYDYARDPLKGEHRWSNAAGGFLSFALIGKANEVAATKNSLLTRTVLRAGAGAAGADAQVLLNQAVEGKLTDKSTLSKLGDATVGGGAMNILLPWAQSKLHRGTDHINTALGRGIPVDRFIAQEGITGRSADHFAKENPLARVQYSEANSPKFRKNIAHIDETIVEATAKIRSAQEAEKAARGEPAKTPQEVHKEALARELAAELHDIEAGRAGKAGSVLSNRDIVKALKDGRLQVSLPTEASGKTEYKPVELEQILGQVGTNSLDLTLGDKFVRLPEGTTLDLGKTHPADFLKTLTTEVHPEGIKLKPGEFVLAFTKEKITLPSEAGKGWNGEPPLTGEINIQSSLARLGLSENITASTLNNGTNNPITHEIKNNGTTEVWLRPGMKFGSVVFHRMSGPPGLGFQQSRMHGQVEPNGHNGNSLGTTEMVVSSRSQHVDPAVLEGLAARNGQAKTKAGDGSATSGVNGQHASAERSTSASAASGEPIPVIERGGGFSAADVGRLAARQSGPESTHIVEPGRPLTASELARRSSTEHAPEQTLVKPPSSFGDAQQFSQHMDSLRANWVESVGRKNSPETYNQMMQAERQFAAETLKNNPQEWDRYINGLKSDRGRQSDYLQALRTEREVMCQMDVSDLLKIPDTERVRTALHLLNDKTKYGQYSDTLVNRRPDAETMARIHDADPDSQWSERLAAQEAQRKSNRDSGAAQPEQKRVTLEMPANPAVPGEKQRYLEDLRAYRDQQVSQGQPSSALDASIRAAEREYAIHALKNNPQEWYAYVDSLQRNPQRYNDYVASVHTEKSVIQHMDVMDLIRIDTGRVMDALKLLNDKTKMMEYMTISSQARYTLSPERLSEIHDAPPPGAPAAGHQDMTPGDKPPRSFFGTRRRTPSGNDDWIRRLLEKRNRGNLNGG